MDIADWGYIQEETRPIIEVRKYVVFEEVFDHPEDLVHEVIDVIAEARLLDALPTHQKQLTRFALATGLRQANVLGLKWSDVDMERRTAWVHADEAKGGEAIGVPLNDDAMAVLNEEKGKHPERVFTYKGRPLGQANTRSWRNALKRAGIKNFRWHDLRHVWATWHVMAGTTMAELQELGAWKSAEMVDATRTSRRSNCGQRPISWLHFRIHRRKATRRNRRKPADALPERRVTLHSGHMGNTSALCGRRKVPWQECYQDGRTASIRRPIAGWREDGGALPRVRCLAQDRLQDLPALQGLRA